MISSRELVTLWNEGFAFCLEYDGKTFIPKGYQIPTTDHFRLMWEEILKLISQQLKAKEPLELILINSSCTLLVLTKPKIFNLSLSQGYLLKIFWRNINKNALSKTEANLQYQDYLLNNLLIDARSTGCYYSIFV